MLDSTAVPFLSLADDTTDFKDDPRNSVVNKSFGSKKSTSSFVSAYDDARVERLEKEVAGLAKRLESEILRRKRLQEILTQSGIKVPSESLE